MAQTKRRRRRKRRGTQSGKVDHRRARPRNRQEARAQARGRSRKKPAQRRPDRRDQPPTWRGAINRGLVAAGIFFALMLLLFSRPLGEAFAYAAFMLAFYIPLGHAIDRFFYNRRQASLRRARERGADAK